MKRPDLKSKHHAQELGGLSGRPLFELSTAMLARARQLAGPDLVLVGAGGVDGAGGGLVEDRGGRRPRAALYRRSSTKGPSLPRRIAAELVKRLEERNIKSIRDVRGIETERWAAAWPR